MSQYVAPIKDMLFAMNELAGLQDITRLPGNEEVSNDLVEAILDEAAKFANQVVDPLNRVGDKQGNKWDNGVVTTADALSGLNPTNVPPNTLKMTRSSSRTL